MGLAESADAVEKFAEKEKTRLKEKEISLEVRNKRRRNREEKDALQIEKGRHY